MWPASHTMMMQVEITLRKKIIAKQMKITDYIQWETAILRWVLLNATSCSLDLWKLVSMEMKLFIESSNGWSNRICKEICQKYYWNCYRHDTCYIINKSIFKRYIDCHQYNEKWDFQYDLFEFQMNLIELIPAFHGI